MAATAKTASVGVRFTSWLQRGRESRQLVLFIVSIALFLDNMMLTTVVPIIPEFLYYINHPNESKLSESPDFPQPTSSLNSSDLMVNHTSQEELMRLHRHEDLIEETVDVGMMFATKAILQLLTNPIVGPLTQRIGYSIPMFTGFVIMFCSTLIFAFGRSYSVLFVARVFQGIGSAFSCVSGLGMLAERYPDDKERGNAMNIALGGLALGVLIGPPFGGFMYEFVGKTSPFLILCALAAGSGMLQLLMLQPGVVKQEAESPSMKSLITDPYILVTAGAISFANMGLAMLEPSLPLWMIDTMGAERWKQGVIFLPAGISYLIGTNLFTSLGCQMDRWLASFIGLLIIGICLMCIPLAHNINHLIVPNAGLGFAIAMVDISMMPELGYLVDIRHSAVYGNVYAIGDMAFCLGFAIGPAMSVTLVNTIGFEWMLFGIGVLTFSYAPLMCMLRNPPTKEDKKVQVEKTLIWCKEGCGPLWSTTCLWWRVRNHLSDSSLPK